MARVGIATDQLYRDIVPCVRRYQLASFCMWGYEYSRVKLFQAFIISSEDWAIKIKSN